VIEEIGGFSSDTLAEDQDLTIEVRKLHYRIGYEEARSAIPKRPTPFGIWQSSAIDGRSAHCSACGNTRGAVKSKVRHARLRCDAKRLDLSGAVSADLAVDGSNVRLDGRGGGHDRA
jgi:Glycosyltransferases, probably involved in cell wall biogenesis